jgi:hypothetical protein
MKKRSLLMAVITFVLVACGKLGNPLLSASDGQFMQWIAPKNAFAPPCAAALYEPAWFVNQYNALKFSARDKISAVTDRQKNDCVADLQQWANQIGITGNITRENLLDDRVKQRYLSLKRR